MHLLNNSAYYKNRSTSANILILPRRIIKLNKEQFTSEICQSTFIPKDLLNDFCVPCTVLNVQMIATYKAVKICAL